MGLRRFDVVVRVSDLRVLHRRACLITGANGRYRCTVSPARVGELSSARGAGEERGHDVGGVRSSDPLPLS